MRLDFNFLTKNYRHGTVAPHNCCRRIVNAARAVARAAYICQKIYIPGC